MEATLVIPIVVIGGIGLLSGIMLSMAAKFMTVSENSQITIVRELLPGINCGACGFVGCDAYAERLVQSSVKTNLCIPGGVNTTRAISVLLGIEFEDIEEKMAIVRCSGTCSKSGYVMDYRGPATCEACNYLYQGRRSCSHACLGFGDCLRACQYNAIYLENGIAYVDSELCTACGKCVEACPNHLIIVVPKSAEIFVGCHSTDSGSFVRKICSAGCIGCGICVKKCQYDAIAIVSNLASIDPEKCVSCGDCREVCPTKVINMARKSDTKQV